MNNLSEKEISHLQEYPEPLRAVYQRVRSHASENGLQPHVTKEYIAFTKNGKASTKNGKSNLVKMYFRKKGYAHFYVCDDKYRYWYADRVPMRDVEQKEARIASVVKSCGIEYPNRGHDYFYLIVNEDGDMDELRDYMKPVLS